MQEAALACMFCMSCYKHLQSAFDIANDAGKACFCLIQRHSTIADGECFETTYIYNRSGYFGAISGFNLYIHLHCLYCFQNDPLIKRTVTSLGATL